MIYLTVYDYDDSVETMLKHTKSSHEMYFYQNNIFCRCTARKGNTTILIS